MDSKFKFKHNEKWLLQLLASMGVDVQELRAKIPEVYHSISTKSELLSINDLELLLNVLEELTGNAHIGLKLAKDTQLKDLGLYGYLVNQSNNIKTFLQTSIKYYPIFYRSAKIELIEKKRYCTFSYSDVIPTKNSSRHDNEWTLSWFVNQISNKLDNSWKPLKVCFSNPEPADLSPLIEVFGENLFFDQSYNSFDVESEVLSHTYSQINPELLSVVKPIADELINKIIVEECFEAKVRVLLMKNLGESSFSRESVAQELFMSESTLKRKLSKINLSFREVRDEVLLYLAKSLLAETNLSVNQIALSLGYSEHSAFNHFFIRVAKQSPRDYRQKIKFGGYTTQS